MFGGVSCKDIMFGCGGIVTMISQENVMIGAELDRLGKRKHWFVHLFKR